MIITVFNNKKFLNYQFQKWGNVIEAPPREDLEIVNRFVFPDDLDQDVRQLVYSITQDGESNPDARSLSIGDMIRLEVFRSGYWISQTFMISPKGFTFVVSPSRK